MTKQDIIRKLTSRKFIISAISALAGILIAIIGHEHEVTAVAGALMAILPTVAYCIMEGRIDAASVKVIGDATAKTAEELGSAEAAEHIETVTDMVDTVLTTDAGATDTTVIQAETV